MAATLLMLGKYRVVRKLGRGSFGVVYLAEDTTLDDRAVALKILYPQLVVDPDTLRLFGQEAGTMARLDHPNIVTVYEAGEIDARRFIAMRYVPGRTLAQVIKEEGPQPPQRVADWLDQVASALDYAHRQNVLHRDIKPSNILLDADGRAVVTDFGLAKAASASGGSASQEKESLSGTARYMAPEAFKNKRVPQSDLYSLGVVLYELLTGQVPFDGEDFIAIGMSHTTDEPRPPREIRPALSEGVDAVVLHSLAKQPSDRFQAAGEMARAFHLALDADARTKRDAEEQARQAEQETQRLAAEEQARKAEQERRRLAAAESARMDGEARARREAEERRRSEVEERARQARGRRVPRWVWALLVPLAVVGVVTTYVVYQQRNLTAQAHATATAAARATAAIESTVALRLSSMGMELAGNSEWYDTALFFRRGETVRIVYLSGLWGATAQPSLSADARGIPGTESYGGNLVPNCNHMALIARVGKGEPWCIAGAYSGPLPAEGNLQLRSNDNMPSDNVGSIHVRIELGANN